MALSRYAHACHEAGHVIAAWHSARVVHVTLAKLGPSRGFVEYAVIPDFHDSPFSRWSHIVVMLAGIAGAFGRGHRVQARDCESDLSEARRLAAELALQCDVYQALPVETTSRTTITRMYAETPGAPVGHVLEAAYLKARALLACYRVEHFTVAVALYCLSELRSAELRELLGPRRIGKIFEFRRGRVSILAMICRLGRVVWRRVWQKSKHVTIFRRLNESTGRVVENVRKTP